MRLERVHADKNEFRFYELDIEPNLFRDHTLVIRWGRIGRPARIRYASSGNLCEILSKARKIEARKRRSGYFQATLI